MDWSFLHNMLISLNFPQNCIHVIMACINSTQYSIMLNSSPSKTIKPKRGLRQGDPMSPILFVLGTEYLSHTLMVIGSHKDFKFHPICKKLKLNHLSFVDDLMLFCNGDLFSAQLLCKGLESFAETLGLCANLAKSAVYLVGLPTDIKAKIAQEIRLPFGFLSFWYLGIPLTSKSISATDYDVLVKKMSARIRSWYAKNLSYAARVQLITSVLMNISSY